jgi:hypothetical protein
MALSISNVRENLPPYLQAYARAIAVEAVGRGRFGSDNGYEAEVVPGNSAPEWTGCSYHYTTPGGKPIRFPKAYGWRMVYHSASRMLTIGHGWLIDRAMEMHRARVETDSAHLSAARRHLQDCAMAREAGLS